MKKEWSKIEVNVLEISETKQDPVGFCQCCSAAMARNEPCDCKGQGCNCPCCSCKPS